ncbi:slipin family protein, partial [Elusimicrobiota bacterium]
GKLHKVKGPGLIFLIPLVDKITRINLRLISIDVPRQELITLDNVPATVDAVVYFRIIDPGKALVQIDNYYQATFLIAQTTLRSVLGQAKLDELLSQRDTINSKLKEIIDQQTRPWGIEVSIVEIKEIALPENMKRSMARQAEKERERRAKIIDALGEFQAAENLVKAASIIREDPIALQLRYLQTIREASAEKSATMFFPLPMELLNHMIGKNIKK